MGLGRDLLLPATQSIRARETRRETRRHFDSIVHIAEPGQTPTPHSLRPGDLEGYFKGWEILYRHEGMASDAPHHRAVAEIVARRPMDS